MIDVGVELTPAGFALLELLSPRVLSIDDLRRRLGWDARQFADALHAIREQGIAVRSPGDGTIRLMPRSVRHAGELAADHVQRHPRH